ncbi:hypothetical protein V2A60_000385 [Cordyceps javanica]
MSDYGGLGGELAAAINDGGIPGPRVYSAGAGSASAPSARASSATRPPLLADGPDECPSGAKCIKIMATGSVVSLDEQPRGRAKFSAEEMSVLRRRGEPHGTRRGRALPRQESKPVTLFQQVWKVRESLDSIHCNQ